ncbi:hypothetical protein M0K80_RS06950 [Providencia rettgeri]|nr:hypothetical protein [Providencia rettgeri]
MTFNEWISNINAEFRDAGIEPQSRPLKAIMRYSEEFNTSISFSSSTAKNIFKWFETHSKPRTHQIGSFHESVYFYDYQFWVISIPLIYGRAQVDMLDCIKEMPHVMKDEMMSIHKEAWKYAIYWADTVDYGLGLDDLKNKEHLDKFGVQFLMAGAQELKAATSILSQHRPDPRAVLNCGLALEMFFKGYIAIKNGLTESEAKAIGHNLNKGFDRFIEISGIKQVDEIRPILKIFPKIHERYQVQDISLENVWKCYSFTHSVGATIVREFTNRNVLKNVIQGEIL